MISLNRNKWFGPVLGGPWISESENKEVFIRIEYGSVSEMKIVSSI